MTDPTLPGRARKAAETLIEVYAAARQLGDDYNLVWEAKEWLYNTADRLEAASDD